MDVRDIEKGHVCVGRLLLQPPGEDPGGGLQVRQAQGHHLLLHRAGLQPQVCVHLAQDWRSTTGVCTLTVLFLFPQTTDSNHSLHSWAQRKLSPLSPLNPLNILLSINGPLLSYGFNGLND